MLFRYASEVYGKDSIAIVHTGMGKDGANGLVPNKESWVVWGMPGSAVNTGLVEKDDSIESIPDVVSELI